MLRADGCFRSHTVGSGVRCEGSGRRPKDISRPPQTRSKHSPDFSEREFGDLSFKELREVAAVAAELEAEQRAEGKIRRRMDAEFAEQQQLKALIRNICGSEEAPDRIQQQLKSEANKWRRKGMFWLQRFEDLQERDRLDLDSWEVELEATRKAMKRCSEACQYIEHTAGKLLPPTSASVAKTTEALKEPTDTQVGSRSTAERLWSAIQRLWS
jgi:hypothetical protein